MYKNVLMASSVAMALGVSSPAAAEMTAQEFIGKVDRGDHLAMIYLAGVSTGIEWANASAHQKLYCPPDKLAIAVEQNLSMLRVTLKEAPGLATTPVGLVLMVSYRRTFPCPG